MKNEHYTKFLAAFSKQYQAILANLPQQFAQYSGMQEAVTDFFAPLWPLAEHGKRLRPYLLTIAANNLTSKTLQAAVAFEMLHLFALVHDDIIDGATKRRAVPTAHIAYEAAGIPGTAGAILLGDYLLVVANDLMRQSNMDAIPLFTEIQYYLCFGQFYEVMHWHTTIQQSVVEQIELFKSAQYSFQYPLRIGFALAGQDPNCLDAFAIPCGLAFQLRDDWLDIAAPEQEGKTAGIDAQNGVANSVQLLLAKHNDPATVKKLVKQQLAFYQKTAQAALAVAAVSDAQKQALTAVLAFSTTIA